MAACLPPLLESPILEPTGVAPLSAALREEDARKRTRARQRTFWLPAISWSSPKESANIDKQADRQTDRKTDRRQVTSQTSKLHMTEHKRSYNVMAACLPPLLESPLLEPTGVAPLSAELRIGKEGTRARQRTFWLPAIAASSSQDQQPLQTNIQTHQTRGEMGSGQTTASGQATCDITRTVGWWWSSMMLM